MEEKYTVYRCKEKKIPQRFNFCHFIGRKTGFYDFKWKKWLNSVKLFRQKCPRLLWMQQKKKKMETEQISKIKSVKRIKTEGLVQWIIIF